MYCPDGVVPTGEFPWVRRPPTAGRAKQTASHCGAVRLGKFGDPFADCDALRADGGCGGYRPDYDVAVGIIPW